jgi:hypothetical protein
MIVTIFSLILITSFLGIFAGIILSNFAVEEIENTSKYLRILNIIIVPVIIFIATYTINITYSLIATSIIAIATIIIHNKIETKWIYSTTGIALYLSTFGSKTLETAILIFIYGISIVTIDASKFFKKKILGEITQKENIALIIKSVKRYSAYIFIGLIVYAVHSILL